jgi:hypothetical protein
MNPYKNKPDIFYLVIHEELLQHFDVRKIKYPPWGKSEEDLCYFGEVLVGSISGKVSDSKVYFEGLNVTHRDRVAIKLTPVLNGDGALNCPAYSAFSKALSDFLTRGKKWDLICEADCEQHPVEEVPNAQIAIEAKLAEVGRFCEGSTYRCPTFIVRAGA